MQSVGTNSCYELEELKKLATDDKIAKIWGRLVDEDVDDEISLRRIKARDSQVSCPYFATWTYPPQPSSST